MQVPAFVVVIGLVIVGYFILRSIVSTLKFSVKLMTWAIVLTLLVGAAFFFRQHWDGSSPSSSFPIPSDYNQPRR